jgi:hypothetical protein
MVARLASHWSYMWQGGFMKYMFEGLKVLALAAL